MSGRDNNEISHLAVIGLGLIGGSAAKAVRAAGGCARVTGFDPDERQRRLAVDLGVVDAVYETAAEAVAGADLVMLAVPVLTTAEAYKQCLAGLTEDVTVTDVGSTKMSVIQDVGLINGGVFPHNFVPAHPIAGTEKSGVANSIANLFHNRRVILTPTDTTSPQAVEKVTRLWSKIGARVVTMQASRHDEIFAATSHLPHLLAYSFVDTIAALNDNDVFANAGGGFRDFTRIASSSPQMWHDIIQANSAAVGDLLDKQIQDLTELRALVRDGRWDELKTRFERARRARERYLAVIE